MKINLKIVWLSTVLLFCLSAYGCSEKAKTVTSGSAVQSADSGKEVAVMNGSEKTKATVGIEYCGG